MVFWLASLAFLRQALPEGWQKVEVSDSISVALPKTASVVDLSSAKTISPPPGEELKRWGFTDGRASYEIDVASLTVDALRSTTHDQILANSVRGVLHSLGTATVTWQRDILLNGWPGLEFTVTSPEQSAACRSYLIDAKLYTVLEVFVTSRGKPINTDVLLGSLAINPTPRKGLLITPGPKFKTIEPKGSKCSLGMPGDPQTKVTKDENAQLTRISSVYGNRAYIFFFADKDKKKTPAEMRHLLLDMLKPAFGGNQMSAPKLVLKGDLTVETQYFESKDGFKGRCEVTVANDLVYAMLMMYPTGHTGAPDIETFFSSFKLGTAAPKAN